MVTASAQPVVMTIQPELFPFVRCRTTLATTPSPSTMRMAVPNSSAKRADIGGVGGWPGPALRNSRVCWGVLLVRFQLVIVGDATRHRARAVDRGARRLHAKFFWNTQVFEIWVRPGISGLALPSSPAGS